MFDLSILVAICAVGVTAAALFIDALQTRAIRRINRRIETESKTFEERGSIGDQFGDWLLEPADDKPDSPTNLQVCASQVGSVIAHSFSMGLKGIKSGDERLERSLERKIIEGVQTPETKAILAACERFGIDPQYASLVIPIANKLGLLPNILKNDGSQEASKSGLEY